MCRCMFFFSLFLFMCTSCIRCNRRWVSFLTGNDHKVLPIEVLKADPCKPVQQYLRGRVHSICLIKAYIHAVKLFTCGKGVSEGRKQKCFLCFFLWCMCCTVDQKGSEFCNLGASGVPQHWLHVVHAQWHKLFFTIHI